MFVYPAAACCAVQSGYVSSNDTDMKFGVDDYLNVEHGYLTSVHADSAATCSRWFLARGFFYLKMEAIHSSETWIHTRSARRHIPEDGILHRHRCENFKSYNLTLL
jgi:hypothetical protein